MRISRRKFACGLTGFALAAAAGQPLAIWERRVYLGGSALPPTEILEHNGIRVVSVTPTNDVTAYLFAFESLEARISAWDRFNADEAWGAIRSGRQVAVKEIRVCPISL